MGTIHLIINQQNDYLTEYPLFFYNNREKFASNGVGIPWLSQERTRYVRQSALAKHAQALADSGSEESALFMRQLEEYEHLIFIAAAGDIANVCQIAELIRKKRISGWDKTSVRCLWLANAKSLDVEGSYRNFPSEMIEKSLYASLEREPAKSLAYIEKTLDFADSATILPEPENGHLDAATLLAALDLPNINTLAPVQNARLNSRELDWFSNRLVEAGMDRQLVAKALKGIDSKRPEPYLDANKLKAFDRLYKKGMEKIAAKFGVDLELSEPFAKATGWRPFVEPNEKRIRELTETVLQAMPQDRELNRYILNHTPKTIFTGFDSVSVPADKALLSVLTLAKNQEKYIGECIESVAMQKTDFPIRHIILDDVSTDETRRIIWQYAQKYKHIDPIFLSEGREYGGNVRVLFNACKSTYASLCDGDDYFTDPMKLQKQVDFLEGNPQCALCFHPVDVVYEDGSPSRVYPPVEMLPGGEKPIYTLKDLLSGNIIQTNSVVYRWRFKDGLPPWFSATLLPGDWYWHILHAELGAIGYLKEHMAVYRRHPKSLYALAEVGHTQNRARHGMKELEFYDTLDRHFKRRMQEPFFNFANGVFADFLKVYVETGDASLLNEACQRYPVFGERFLREIKIN